MKKIIFVFIMLFSSSVFANNAIYTGFFSNKAVSGYDVVTYFSEGAPRKGSKKFKTKYKKADWLFVSQENLEKFKADPEKYAPQYGGYCAWAISEQNDKVKASPLNWNIVDGKLYLNYDKEIKQRWEKNIPGFIVKADENWPKLTK